MVGTAAPRRIEKSALVPLGQSPDAREWQV